MKINEEIVYLIIRVDDFLSASRIIKEIHKVADYLKGKFQLLDLGFLKCYLGVEIGRNEDGMYCMKQTQYIDNTLTRFGLQGTRISNVPLDPGYMKIQDQPLMENSEKYQQLIGALL